MFLTISLQRTLWGDQKEAVTVSKWWRIQPIDSVGQRARRVSPVLLVMVVRPDAGNGQRAGDDGQRGRRSRSVSLATLVGCCAEGGQVAGATIERDGSMFLCDGRAVDVCAKVIAEAVNHDAGMTIEHWQ